jgi:hypothetical protein
MVRTDGHTGLRPDVFERLVVVKRYAIRPQLEPYIRIHFGHIHAHERLRVLSRVEYTP